MKALMHRKVRFTNEQLTRRSTKQLETLFKWLTDENVWEPYKGESTAHVRARDNSAGQIMALLSRRNLRMTRRSIWMTE